MALLTKVEVIHYLMCGYIISVRHVREKEDNYGGKPTFREHSHITMYKSEGKDWLHSVPDELFEELLADGQIELYKQLVDDVELPLHKTLNISGKTEYETEQFYRFKDSI